MTGSTTQGLGTIYAGLKLKPGQEILSTEQDHIMTKLSLRLRAERMSTPVHTISLYDRSDDVTEEGLAGGVMSALTPQTRVVAITWVQSSTGVKMPVGRIAQGLAHINLSRSEEDQVLLCVDGLHGFGVEDVTASDLGCDFFIAAHRHAATSTDEPRDRGEAPRRGCAGHAQQAQKSRRPLRKPCSRTEHSLRHAGLRLSPPWRPCFEFAPRLRGHHAGVPIVQVRASRSTTRRTILTSKAPAALRSSRDRRYKEKLERELVVPGPPTRWDRKLRSLGLRPGFRYDKIRSTFRLSRLPGLAIELDETPAGTFLELEGLPRAIDRTARALGYSSRDYYCGSYWDVYVADCRRRGITPRNMVFDKQK